MGYDESHLGQLLDIQCQIRRFSLRIRLASPDCRSKHCSEYDCVWSRLIYVVSVVHQYAQGSIHYRNSCLGCLPVEDSCICIQVYNFSQRIWPVHGIIFFRLSIPIYTLTLSRPVSWQSWCATVRITFLLNLIRALLLMPTRLPPH